MLEAEHHDEYNELASKPEPLSDDEQIQLLHHKSRLAAALEAEYFSSPRDDKLERFESQWREWFGEDPPTPETAMRGLHEYFVRPEQRAALEGMVFPPDTLLNMLLKREPPCP
jgi:hypothetical protein